MKRRAQMTTVEVDREKLADLWTRLHDYVHDVDEYDPILRDLLHNVTMELKAALGITEAEVVGAIKRQEQEHQKAVEAVIGHVRQQHPEIEIIRMRRARDRDEPK
jgi:hypothetical protein